MESRNLAMETVLNHFLSWEMQPKQTDHTKIKQTKATVFATVL